MAGYSGRPLAAKLGVKEGMRAAVVGAPVAYRTLLDPCPEGVEVSERVAAGELFLHLFVRSTAELDRELPRLAGALAPAGTLWVSWPKRASGVPTDLTEDVVRARALALRLVDVKVCAVDDTWSALKLVVPVASRAGWPA